MVFLWNNSTNQSWNLGIPYFPNYSIIILILRLIYVYYKKKRKEKKRKKEINHVFIFLCCLPKFETKYLKFKYNLLLLLYKIWQNNLLLKVFLFSCKKVRNYQISSSDIYMYVSVKLKKLITLKEISSYQIIRMHTSRFVKQLYLLLLISNYTIWRTLRHNVCPVLLCYFMQKEKKANSFFSLSSASHQIQDKNKIFCFFNSSNNYNIVAHKKCQLILHKLWKIKYVLCYFLQNDYLYFYAIRFYC